MNPYFFHAATLAALAFTMFQLSTLGKAVMSTQETVDALVAQVAKVKAEVIAARDVLTARVAEVQAALDAAGVAAEQVDLSALQAAVQDLDDINPDPVVEPVVEPPLDVPVDEPQDAPPF